MPKAGLTLSAMLLALPAYANDALLSESGSEATRPPVGCEFLSVGPAAWIDSLDPSGQKIGKEFSFYRVYICSRANPQKFVLRRIRHYKGGDQIVGELVIPETIFLPSKNVRPRAGQPPYIFSFTVCGTEANFFESKYVDALFTLSDTGRPRIERVFFAWRVNTRNKTLYPLALKELVECYSEY